ncbi:YjeF family domain-containing protein [Propionibacterium sp. oral taxon 192 str. F0372]|uniref:NAD(P)H-hydrate epimerase n=1 Tax=Propionibacterium sp. oral taxon 192 TaxID=671222 RepID=UPI0003539E16|nr:NAD(P)H-hydrate epimerase [Propionibacterium sp. oral taxon 192]EPH02342.1 YjeF family domain-containing protein [Propionibacterium sp. oral taxon 192 str. F0372]
MIGIHSVQQIRAAEVEFESRNPDISLMQRAALKVAERAMQMAPKGTILVAVGPGNNGGDGLYAVRELMKMGRHVLVWQVTDKAHPGGVIAARQLGARFMNTLAVMRQLPEISLVIDAVVGLGSHRGLSEEMIIFAEEVRTLSIPVLAVDIPSGLDPDSHLAPEHAVHANWTVVFSAPQLCHLAQPAASYCGDVEIIDLGCELPDTDIQQMQRVDVARWWPWPTQYADKYSRGGLGIDTGSDRYPGAAILSVTGAVFSGAGILRFSGPPSCADMVVRRQPSVTIGRGRVQAWLVGCGWGDGPENEHRLDHVLEAGIPAVVDAEALVHIPAALPEGWLMTPHAGELATIMGVKRAEVVADPIRHAREAAKRWKTTVLLKGATQYIAEENGRVTLAIPGPAWTAQAGSGDVLAGICGTLMAAGLPAWKAASMGASVQAMAATHRPGPYPPERQAEVIPEVLAHLAGVIGDQAILAGNLTPNSIAVA